MRSEAVSHHFTLHFYPCKAGCPLSFGAELAASTAHPRQGTIIPHQESSCSPKWYCTALPQSHRAVQNTHYQPTPFPGQGPENKNTLGLFCSVLPAVRAPRYAGVCPHLFHSTPLIGLIEHASRYPGQTTGNHSIKLANEERRKDRQRNSSILAKVKLYFCSMEININFLFADVANYIQKFNFFFFLLKISAVFKSLTCP